MRPSTYSWRATQEHGRSSQGIIIILLIVITAILILTVLILIRERE